MQSRDYAKRHPAAKHPGVYYRLKQDGSRSYGYAFRDSNGKQHFVTVGPSLAEAISARSKTHTRVAAGETVAPTSARFEDVAAAWLASKGKVRSRTRENYETAIRVHLNPRLGNRKVASITVDDLAGLIRELELHGSPPRRRPLAAWTIHGVITTMSGIFKYALRRGMIHANPLLALEHDERPGQGAIRQRALTRDEIGRILAKAREPHRTMFATCIFTGCRPSEVLGLRWRDVDFKADVVHVRHQLAEERRSVVPTKTDAGVRDVILLPELATMLKRHRLASPLKGPDNFVFSSADGRGGDRHNTARRLKHVAEKAGVQNVQQRDFRHTFAALLIDRQPTAGYSDEFIAEQLGHSSSAITRSRYSYLFDRQKHTDAATAALSAEFGGILK